MNTRLKLALVVLMLCFVVTGATTLADGSLAQGELSISIDQSEYAVAEPIVVHFLWKNLSRKTFTRGYTSGELFMRSNLSLKNLLGVEVQPKLTTYESFYMRPVTLRPGQTFTWASLTLDTFGFSLPQGKYTLIDHFDGPTGNRDSNTISFKVR